MSYLSWRSSWSISSVCRMTHGLKMSLRHNSVRVMSRGMYEVPDWKHKNFTRTGYWKSTFSRICENLGARPGCVARMGLRQNICVYHVEKFFLLLPIFVLLSASSLFDNLPCCC